ncbi:hypothetical protein EBD34_RS16675 [Escherichia coli]|nr:hypothetical protein [Escherichia coli]
MKKAFEGELNFVLKLAREMGRADWRAMLAGMTSTECIDSLEVRKKPGGHWIIRDLIGLDLVGLASL